ncbi:MAG: cyclic nucleotide-binding protein [Pseudomonadota bacterium]
MTGFSFPEVIGYIGVALILIGYAGIQSGRLTADMLVYPILNGVGALAILFSLYFHPNIPSIVIEIAWLLISSFGIFRYFSK